MKAYSKQTMETYHVHMETSNTSFLKMAVLLQSMGVENCYFHLKLFDKSLKDVDPFDRNLSSEMRFRVFRECSDNRWYFYREVFRVTEAGASTSEGGGSEFKLNRGNMAYLWAMEMNISAYLILPRQTGKTWAAIADDTWTHQFVRGSTLLHFNKNQKDANDNLRRIQGAIRMLPLYLQHSNNDNLDPSDKRLVKNNEKTIRNVIDSTIEAMASAGNESRADALARGRTASKIWYDEMSFIFFNETIYSAATPAYEKAAELAQRNGAPFAISITTTPGDLATPHGAFAYKMMQDSVRFSEAFYDYGRKRLYDEVYGRDDKVPFVFIQYSYLQLGETEEWYLTRFKKMNNPLKARREYLLEWINSNGNSPFDPDDVDLIGDLARQREANAKIYKLNKYYDVTVYDEYTGKKPVLIGVDVASVYGKDSSAIVAVNPETLHPLAIFRSNMIDSNKLRKLIMTIVKRMYPNCILTIENNSVGKPLIDELKETAVSRVLYKERKKSTVEQGASPVTKKKFRMDSVMYGHNTNPNTRPQMMDILTSVVHNSPSHFGYKELYDEIRFLEYRNGRIDHSAATHDDVTMAYLGVLWIVRHGTGLKNRGIYYNIEDGPDGLEENLSIDISRSLRLADRLLSGVANDEEEQQAEALVDYLRREHHVQTSEDLMHAERMEYFKELDRIAGIETDDGDEPSIDNISMRTQALILQNYNNMMQYDPYTDDPISMMLRPTPIEEREQVSFADLYRWD